MKNKFLFLLFTLSFLVANSQSKLDSLLTNWKDETKSDSIRVYSMLNYIQTKYLYSDPDKALTLTQDLIDFSELKNYQKGVANGNTFKGVIFTIKGDNASALKYYQESLKAFKTLNNKKGMALALVNIASIYYYEGNFQKALELNKKSLKILEADGNQADTASPIDFIGTIYFRNKNYDKALEYYLRAYEINKSFDDKRSESISLNNISNVYAVKGDFTSALKYAQRSIYIDKEQNNLDGMAKSMLNVGDLFASQGNFLKAIEYSQNSLTIMKKIGNTYGIAKSLSNIGTLKNKLKNYTQAIIDCNKSIELAEQINDIHTKKESIECLYEAYKALGNGNKALAYHEQMLVLNDSLQSEETAKKLQQMEFAKQVMADSLVKVEKDLKVEMAHQTEVRQKDKNKNMALGAGMFFLLLSGGFYGRWRYVKKTKTIIEKEKDRSENLLLNILPSEIAEELKLKGSADARDFDLVSVIFTDFKGFTKASEQLTAKELIAEINHCFMAFDHICETYGIEKIKTIGDAYMAVGGLPIPTDDSVKQTVLAAIEMQAFITNRIKEKLAKNEVPFEMRVGIHTGPVVAGIVGVKKFQYDIWGDTVNTAARMESSGEIRQVNISQDTYDLIKDDPQFSFVSRGKIQAKSKGEIDMYFVTKQS